MKNSSSHAVKRMTQAAIIAAIYVVLVVIWPFSSGAIQVRLSEALTILPAFTPAAIEGVTLGCLIANIVTGCALPDIIFGTVATFIGVLIAYMLRKNLYLVPVPTILSNTLILPFVIKYAYTGTASIPYLAATIFAGEFISAGILGVLLGKVLNKYKNVLFKN
jgi:uncharacterized membrane protein